MNVQAQLCRNGTDALAALPPLEEVGALLALPATEVGHVLHGLAAPVARHGRLARIGGVGNRHALAVDRTWPEGYARSAQDKPDVVPAEAGKTVAASVGMAVMAAEAGTTSAGSTRG